MHVMWRERHTSMQQLVIRRYIVEPLKGTAMRSDGDGKGGGDSHIGKVRSRVISNFFVMLSLQD